MTLYAIFDPQPGRAALPAAIPERFSWAAALVPPLFLLRHGLWAELAIWVLKLVALVLLARVIGGAAAAAVYVVAAVWLGFAASGLRRNALTRRGWRHRGDRFAASTDLARLGALT